MLSRNFRCAPRGRNCARTARLDDASARQCRRSSAGDGRCPWLLASWVRKKFEDASERRTQRCADNCIVVHIPTRRRDDNSGNASAARECGAQSDRHRTSKAAAMIARSRRAGGLCDASPAPWPAFHLGVPQWSMPPVCDTSINAAEVAKRYGGTARRAAAGICARRGDCAGLLGRSPRHRGCGCSASCTAACALSAGDRVHEHSLTGGFVEALQLTPPSPGSPRCPRRPW